MRTHARTAARCDTAGGSERVTIICSARAMHMQQPTHDHDDDNDYDYDNEYYLDTGFLKRLFQKVPY